MQWNVLPSLYLYIYGYCVKHSHYIDIDMTVNLYQKWNIPNFLYKKKVAGNYTNM